jgi:hypothetical protein
MSDDTKEPTLFETIRATILLIAAAAKSPKVQKIKSEIIEFGNSPDGKAVADFFKSLPTAEDLKRFEDSSKPFPHKPK